MTHEETMQKIKEAQEGDKGKAEEILLDNMPLIKSIVRRYRSSQIEYDDLIQLGSLGLIKAVMNFNLEYNVRFSTYAVPMIAGEIKRHLRDDGPIKVSRQTKTLSMAIGRFVEEFRNDNRDEPTISEIAEHFAVTDEEVVFALDSSKMPLSLYESYDEDGTYLVDILKTEDKTEDFIDKLVLTEIINGLEERDKKIILLRYFRDKTQSEVAAILGISQVQVSRIEARVIAEIRKKML